MSRKNLKDRLAGGLFLLDGATGTELVARGARVSKCNEYLNIESPDIVVDVHRAYIEAGSDAVLANTFGANKYALSRHGLVDELAQINRAGAELARKAAGDEKYVFGDIGPNGDFLKPLGTLEPQDLADAFAAQAEALLAGGVDGLIVETMTALDELEVAVQAVKSVCGDLPVFASLAFDKAGDDFRTMMGVSPEAAVATIAPLGVDAIGFNCGKMSLDDYIELAARFTAAVKAGQHDTAVLAEPNAGLPELIDGRAVYNLPSHDFAAAVERIQTAGVNIIGGCCGSTPQHIRAVAKSLSTP